jgi:hypothetical protein
MAFKRDFVAVRQSTFNFVVKRGVSRRPETHEDIKQVYLTRDPILPASVGEPLSKEGPADIGRICRKIAKKNHRHPSTPHSNRLTLSVCVAALHVQLSEAATVEAGAELEV